MIFYDVKTMLQSNFTVMFLKFYLNYQIIVHMSRISLHVYIVD